MTGLPDDDAADARREPFLMHPANVQQPVRLGSLDDEQDFDVVIRQVRPRPEIILRWKRFGLLMLLAVTLLASINAVFMVGIPVGNIVKTPEQIEEDTKRYNNISGLFMGFAEAIVGELLKYLFPVFIVYLHNVHWFRGDDPASKPTPKIKRIALMLFFPLLMIAIGSSLSAVQTNPEENDDASGAANRRLLETEAALVLERRDTERSDALDSVLRSVLSPSAELSAVANKCPKSGVLSQLARAASSTRVDAKVPIHDWSAALVAAVASAPSASDLVPSTATKILDDGLQTFQHIATSSGVSVNAPSIPQASGDIAEAAASALRSMGANVTAGLDLSTLRVETQRLLLHADVRVESVTLTAPRSASESSVCSSTTGCLVGDEKSLLRRRVRQQIVWTAPSADAQSVLVVAFSAPVGREPSLQWTFTQLSWSFSDDALVLPLEASGRKLVLPRDLVPDVHSQSPVLLAQLLEPPLAWTVALRAPVDVVLRPSASAAADADSAACVDAIVDDVNQRRVFFSADEAPRTSSALALLALFQATHPVPSDATVASPALAWGRRRLEERSSRFDTGRVFVSNTPFGQVAAFVASGLIVVLVFIVLAFPNARARLEPPQGGNVRAERFVAVQTEEVYPNFIYKKRIRGRDAKKVKFREFAVESVTLHHRMEETVQIKL